MLDSRLIGNIKVEERERHFFTGTNDFSLGKDKKPIKSILNRLNNFKIKICFTIAFAFTAFLACDKDNKGINPILDPPTINYTYLPNVINEGTVDSVLFTIEPNDYEIYNTQVRINGREPNFFNIEGLTGKAIWNTHPLDTGEVNFEVVLQTDLGEVILEKSIPTAWGVEDLFSGNLTDGNQFSISFIDDSELKIQLSLSKESSLVSYVLYNEIGIEIGNGVIEEGETKKIYTHILTNDQNQKVVLTIEEIRRSEDEDIIDSIYWKISKIVE
jgi:hypothetical protein